ncbi:TetR/AcrR family transcriptional regulator [Rhodoferax sp. UBA5149]|uniref:TetR/AcrR family transcriptional regulator n=1 Tax=Rhodoferax sp. UBA5149 TaxID=1947379 RepID=UPI0025D50FEF|nr:TetR/AcrR family transcriptional regulator [Rhodoferax sp. UBA5149]
MRYAKEHKQETHQRILRKAGERFRAEGLDAVGVANLMESLGLTVGGFYAHFDSKQALITEACNDGFSRTTTGFSELVRSKPKGEKIHSVINAYLSKHHRDKPEEGCFAAANSAEFSRHPIETRTAFTRQLMAWVEVIEEALNADGLSGDAKGIASSMVGAMTLARAIDDPILSNAFLESGKRTIKAGLVEGKKRRPSSVVERSKLA